MKVIESEILYNKKIKDKYFIMGFECKYLKNSNPGQFFTMSISGIEKSMPVRRPFTIYKVENNKIEILYKVVGRGTGIFSKLEKGDKINVLGPLGNSFRLFHDLNVLLIGRGCGTASLARLGEKLHESGCRVTTVGSFRDDSKDIIEDYVRSFSDKVIIVKDDDSSSSMQNVKRIINDINPDVIYCSGSKRILKMLQTLKYEAYTCLEERMGCGLGGCLGCSVKTVHGYKRICKDGPCFNVKEVIL